jgi:hypothetical protein
MGVSVRFWNQTPQHESENAVIFEAQKVALAMVKNQKDDDHFLDEQVFDTHRIFCLKEIQWKGNSAYCCWKGYWSGFWEWGRSFERKTTVSFARQCPSWCCHNIAALAGELLLGNQPSNLFFWRHTSRLFDFPLRWKSLLKSKISGRRRHQEERIHRINPYPADVEKMVSS